MTDFASQGKTRPYNPVDLNNCRSHQAYYTALSRSASADGTVILQGFEPKKITGKASGALRQEFRDLELLDEITKLQYLSKLPSSVYGDSRNTLIHTFRLHKGLTYVPKNVHPSIQWDKNDPMLEPILDVTLKQGAPEPISILTQDTLLKGPVKDTVPMNHTTPARGLKRKDMSPKKEHKQKKAKLHSHVEQFGIKIAVHMMQS
ncbi:hypothetical protein AX14_009534 [Amanita brunnescens Koide BX004]|nr:hypothetical protein AX14_009534 [Amanita brunnescens Koide BX004]